MIPSNKVLDTDVNQKILMLVDVVTGYMDMMERHDKGLMKEHKVATEKIGMIKCRDLRGALATDIEMKNLLENNINQHRPGLFFRDFPALQGTNGVSVRLSSGTKKN